MGLPATSPRPGGYLRHADQGTHVLIKVVQRAVNFARENGVTPAIANAGSLSYPRRRHGDSFQFIRGTRNFRIKNMLTVGTEWLIEASGCDAEALRDVGRLRRVFERALQELDLRVVGEPLWHKFPGEGGATGLAMLTESHLACHTYPEVRAATFNLYCCRERPEWPWAERLREMLGAETVSVRCVRRGAATQFGDEVRNAESLPAAVGGSVHAGTRGGEA